MLKLKVTKGFLIGLFVVSIFVIVPFYTVLAGSCTDWSTYGTGASWCTQEWCNPIWPWAGNKEMQTQYQSRVCNIDGGYYEIQYRTIVAHISCDC